MTWFINYALYSYRNDLSPSLSSGSEFPNDTRVCARELEWGTDGYAAANETVNAQQFDIAIMSDVLYCNEAIPLLVDTINACVKPNGMVCTSRERERTDMGQSL